MTKNELTLLESVFGQCNHSQETRHGALVAVNPTSGVCQICMRKVKQDDKG